MHTLNWKPNVSCCASAHVSAIGTIHNSMSHLMYAILCVSVRLCKSLYTIACHTSCCWFLIFISLINSDALFSIRARDIYNTTPSIQNGHCHQRATLPSLRPLLGSRHAVDWSCPWYGPDASSPTRCGGNVLTHPSKHKQQWSTLQYRRAS